MVVSFETCSLNSFKSNSINLCEKEMQSLYDFHLITINNWLGFTYANADSIGGTAVKCLALTLVCDAIALIGKLNCYNVGIELIKFEFRNAVAQSSMPRTRMPVCVPDNSFASISRSHERLVSSTNYYDYVPCGRRGRIHESFLIRMSPRREIKSNLIQPFGGCVRDDDGDVRHICGIFRPELCGINDNPNE